MPTSQPPRPPASVPALPPFGLAIVAFPFPALARLAGRAQLGDTRETVLACLTAARLTIATMPPYTLSDQQREARAAAALAWLSAIAVPDDVRPALVALFESTGAAGPDTIAAALVALRGQASSALDEDAAAELDQLCLRLRLA